MRVLAFAPCLAAGASAQSVISTFIEMFLYDPTLTLVGSGSSATTYEKSCPTLASGTGAPEQTSGGAESLRSAVSLASNSIPVVESRFSSLTGGFTARPSATVESVTAIHVSTMLSNAETSTPTAAPLRARDIGLITLAPGVCLPYTMTHGPSTYEFHMTATFDNGVSVTRDEACSWTGTIRTTPIDFPFTCTVEAKGPLGWTGTGTEVAGTETLQKLDAVQTVAIVDGRNSDEGGGSSTTGGNDEGAAPGRHMPTGAVMMAGGAAGLIAGFGEL